MLSVVVADPPWLFKDRIQERGAQARYECMTTERICRMPLPDLGANAVLFLWRVATMQREALAVIDAWRFTLKTELVWQKTTTTGKPHFGLGRYVRASHETCLIATRGRAFPEVRTIRSRFSAPVREHSQKPEEFYAIVERLYPFSWNTKHYEFFARTRRPGYVQHGAELGALPLVS
jgi:N6-adenosine-specific RNA methylase IME4